MQLPETMDRYRQLRTNFTDTHPLLIDTEAKDEDIQSAARQRIRAATDLLETFSCLTFEHADLKDISHIINALYLLVQDGCDCWKPHNTYSYNRRPTVQHKLASHTANPVRGGLPAIAEHQAIFSYLIHRHRGQARLPHLTSFTFGVAAKR